jgi:membrane protein YdbS with pleckstrin-like domain
LGTADIIRQSNKEEQWSGSANVPPTSCRQNPARTNFPCRLEAGGTLAAALEFGRADTRTPCFPRPVADSRNTIVPADDVEHPADGLFTSKTTVPAPGPGGTGMAFIPSPEFQALDARVIGLWRLTSSIGFGVLLAIALIAGLFIGLGLLENPALTLGIWTALAALCGWVVWGYPPRAYRAWSYRIDEQVLETRSGVWFRVVKLLPLSRLQHVDLHRGPLERSRGLASLTLHTAGTHEATIVIPGLDADEAVRLRDRLVVAGGDDAV